MSKNVFETKREITIARGDNMCTGKPFQFFPHAEIKIVVPGEIDATFTVNTHPYMRYADALKFVDMIAKACESACEGLHVEYKKATKEMQSAVEKQERPVMDAAARYMLEQRREKDEFEKRREEQVKQIKEAVAKNRQEMGFA